MFSNLLETRNGQPLHRDQQMLFTNNTVKPKRNRDEPTYVDKAKKHNSEKNVALSLLFSIHGYALTFCPFVLTQLSN